MSYIIKIRNDKNTFSLAERVTLNPLSSTGFDVSTNMHVYPPDTHKHLLIAQLPKRKVGTCEHYTDRQM